MPENTVWEAQNPIAKGILANHPNIVALFKKLENRPGSPTGDKLGKVMGDKDFRESLDKALEGRVDDVAKLPPEVIDKNIDAVIANPGKVIPKILEQQRAATQEVQPEAHAHATHQPEASQPVYGPQPEPESPGIAAINPRFDDPLGTAGTGMEGASPLDENDPLFDPSRYDNEFLDKVKAGTAGAATAAVTTSPPSSAPAAATTPAAPAGVGGQGAPDVSGGTVSGGAGFNFQGTLKAMQAQYGADFDKFFEKAVTPAEEGGLGLAGSLNELAEDPERAQALMSALKEKAANFKGGEKGQNMFGMLNEVIDDASPEQRKGLSERFENLIEADKGGIDLAFQNLQEYAGGVGFANSPLGGVLGPMMGSIMGFLQGMPIIGDMLGPLMESMIGIDLTDPDAQAAMNNEVGDVVSEAEIDVLNDFTKENSAGLSALASNLSDEQIQQLYSALSSPEEMVEGKVAEFKETLTPEQAQQFEAVTEGLEAAAPDYFEDHSAMEEAMNMVAYSRVNEDLPEVSENTQGQDPAAEAEGEEVKADGENLTVDAKEQESEKMADSSQEREVASDQDHEEHEEDNEVAAHYGRDVESVLGGLKANGLDSMYGVSGGPAGAGDFPLAAAVVPGLPINTPNGNVKVAGYKPEGVPPSVTDPAGPDNDINRMRPKGPMDMA